MTFKDLKEKVKQMDDVHRKAVIAVQIEFAKSNDPHSIGDIIEDHMGKGLILSKRCHLGSGDLPTMVYHCQNLTKKGAENKREPRRSIYQLNTTTYQKIKKP